MWLMFSYKSNAVDRCRGCVMERYDSAFVTSWCKTEEELVDRVVELESKLEWNDSSFDHYVVTVADFMPDEWGNPPASYIAEGLPGPVREAANARLEKRR